jgi:hypothetical protein
MPHPLLKTTPGVVKTSASGNPRVFSAANTVTSWSGANLNVLMATVPDGSSESLLCMDNLNQNTTMSVDFALENRVYKFPLAMTIFLDDARTQAGATATTANIYNVADCRLTFYTGGTLSDPLLTAHMHIFSLTRGWNTIIIGGEQDDATANTGALSTKESRPNNFNPGNGTGGGAIPHTLATTTSTGATYSSSIWDEGAAAKNVRLTISSAGATERQRVFLKEMVDNFHCKSLTCNIFDDGYASVYSIAFEYMKKRGLVGVVPIITDKVGTANYLTWAQIGEMYAAGWDIIPHGYSHPNAVDQFSYTVGDAMSEIGDCAGDLENRGYTRRNMHLYYVSPQGGFLVMRNSVFREAVGATDMVASFGTLNGNAGSFLLSPHFIPRMNYNTLSTITGWSASALETHYEKAVRKGMSPMIMWHDIVESGADSGTKILRTEFERAIDLQLRLHKAKLTTVCGVTEAVPAMLASNRSMTA